MVILTLIALIGIELSSWLVTGITILETGGLLYIIWIARAGLADLPARLPEMMPSIDLSSLSMIVLGAFLAFYAFIGFEDLANTAEELKNPKRDMPRAIVIMMIVATILYLLVALVAVLGLPLETLQASEKPLALLYEQTTGKSPIIISLISLFSVMNGILVQIIMASRLMYGMADKQRLPKFL
ncbi:MAG: APC family permease [Candidatus Peribacteria bacterium]|nr:MAG: APC family permease [Candidatus Peribacteria bacterium]